MTPSAEDGKLEERVVALHVGGHVRVRLVGQGPALLMINGVGGHIDMWGSFATDLARTRRLVLFDAPGSGMSPPLDTWMRMPALAGVVAQLIESLDVAPLDVLGYSWGGALAQQLAHDHPELVKRLVLVATIPGVGGRPPKLRVTWSMLSPARYSSPERSRELSATIYGGDYRPQEGRVPQELPETWVAHAPTTRGYAQQLFAISGWSSIPWLRRLSQDTLIISGEDDPLVPRVNARILAALIPRSELHLIAGGGHLWLLDHSADSAALIEGFLHKR